MPLLVFGGTAFIAFNVMSIGIGRAKKTQFNWVVTGVAALVNIGLKLRLIPPYGMIGAAISTLVAYLVMFFGMTIRAQQVFPVPYQWRRIALAVGAAVGLTVLGKSLDVPLGGALLLSAVYPLVLLPLGFYLPVERRADPRPPAGAGARRPGRSRPRRWGPRRTRCRRGCGRRPRRSRGRR